MNKNIKLIANSIRQRRGAVLLQVYLLGPLLFLLLVWFIYHQMLRQPNWRISLTEIWQAIIGPQQWKLWLVFALMPVNWGIEARKWQLAMRRTGGIRYRDAFRAIFAGAALASFTPNRMGEYLGRILYVQEGKRLDSISLTIVGSISQLLITLLAGISGLLFIRPWLQERLGTGAHWAIGFYLLLGLVLLLGVSLTIIYFRLSLLSGILRRIPVLKRYIGYLTVLENFEVRALLQILGLSAVRYLVFIVQYGLVFSSFGVLLTVGQLWGGVSVVFLLMAVVPTFTFLTELGLRWEAGIQVLQLFSGNTVGIFAASFTIWLINLIIPALIGSFLILSIKFFKSR